LGQTGGVPLERGEKMLRTCGVAVALFALVALASVAGAAEGDELWVEVYGGSDVDWGNDLATTADGGLILAGITHSFGADARDVYMIKLDASNAVEWEVNIGTVANDEAEAVIQTSDGGYLVAGNFNVGGFNTMDGLLMKVDADGDVEWSETYGGSYDDEFMDVVECASGGYCAAGNTGSYGPGGYVAWLVRVDDMGVQQWQTAVPLQGNGKDYLTGLVERPDGKFAASAYTGDSNTFTDYDAEAVGFSSTGTLQWRIPYDYSPSDYGLDITVIPSGGLAMTGDAGGVAAVWRVNDNGTPDWFNYFNVVESGHSIKATGSGDLLIGGDTYNANIRMGLGRMDTDGNILLDVTFDDGHNEDCAGVVERQNGEYALVGAYNVGTTMDRSLVLRLVEGPGAAGIDDEVAGATLARSLRSLPNPFRQRTAISFALSRPAEASISVADVSGRRVKTLVKGELLPEGRNELVWDGTDDAGRRLASGVYFVQVRAGDEVAHKKLVSLE
jgi:hypothetical protein